MSFKDRFREVEDIYSYQDDEEGFLQFIKKGYVPKKKFKTEDRTFRTNIVYKIPTDEKLLKEIEEEEADIEEYTLEIGYLFEIDIGKNTYNIATREDEMLESDVEAITKDVEYYGIKGLAKALLSKEYVSSYQREKKEREREKREKERREREESKRKMMEEEDDDDDEEYEEIMRGLTRKGDDDDDFDDDEEPQVITKKEEPQPEPRVAKPTERRVAFAQQLWIDPPKVLTETEKSLKTEIEKAYQAAGDDEDEDEEESAYTKALMSATMAEEEEAEEEAVEAVEEDMGDLTEADGVNLELIPFDRKIFIRLGDDTTAYDAEGNKLGMLLEVSGELGDYYQAFLSNDVLKYLETGVPVSRDVGTPSTIILPEKIVEAQKPAPVQIKSIPVAPLAPTRAQPMEEQAINKTPNKVEGYTITRISNLSKTELVDLFGQIFGTNKYDTRFATQLSVPTLQHIIRKSQGMSFDATKIK